MPILQPLSERFADLPLILCGPFVRRVEPEIISVWVALKEKRDIVLEVYTGYCTPSNASFPEKQVAFASARTPTLQIGKNLHIAVVHIDTNGMLTPGSIYSYNLLFFTGANETENLISLGLLDEPELLGFKKGQLPSVLTAPEKLEDLRIAHGSCRKPHGKGRDGLAILSTVMSPDFIEPDRIHDPRSRPHCLFHTGDQIYADDCNDFMIQHYTDAGNFLLERVEELPFPKLPDQDYSLQVDKDENYVWIEATAAAFAPGRRATNFYSGLTGDEGNHLFSLAEFCAAYIFQWSDVLWLEKFLNPATQKNEFRLINLPSAANLFKDRVNDTKETRTYLQGLVKKGEEGEGTAEVPANWDTLTNDQRAFALTPAPTDPILIASMNRYVTGRERATPDDAPRQKERVAEFRNGLKAVRRVMANTPSIMCFDDHDITDDWYLTGGWTKRVLANRLGETIVRNGLLAFALFQAWGNDPKAWADTTPNNNARNKLLTDIPLLVAAFKPLTTGSDIVSTSMPAGYKPLIANFHYALGFADFDKPPVKWHCSLKIGPTKAFVLDTRTRRDFADGLDFPPNLLRKSALTEQLPGNAMPFGTELAFIISGAPVLGLAVMESITQPFASRIAEVKASMNDHFDVKRRRRINTSARGVGNTGSEAMDVEHWSIHEAGFQALLKRCATFKKVIFLAGDVHYGITSEMDYWVKGEPEAARFVQMVSSSLKNIKPEGQLMGLLPAAFVENVLTGGLNHDFANVSSIGWEKEEDVKKLKLRVRTSTDPDVFDDARPGQFPLRYAYALSKKSVSIQLRDWPLKEFKPDPATPGKILPGIVFKKDIPAPSFRWSMKILPDERADTERFNSLSAAFPNLIADIPKNDNSSDAYKDGLQKILQRSSFLSRNHMNRFINWYSHIAIIHFEKKQDEFFALHSMFFVPQLPAPDNLKTGTMEFPYLRYRASLNKKPVAAQPAFPLEGS